MKLNLGSGANNKNGYVNIDKYALFSPDLVWDLEKTPYPFETDSIEEILAHHVLEHLGRDPDVFFAIMQELYRILLPGGLLDVVVPPGHGEQFAADPTHVRPIYPQTFAMFSKAQCKLWRDNGAANTPLADYLDIDFESVSVEVTLAQPWFDRYNSGEVTMADLEYAGATHNGVYRQVRIVSRKVARAA